MGTLNERSAKAQIIWNSTLSNSIDPIMVGSLFYDINIQKLERDNSNAVYETADETYTKVAAINPTTKKWALIDVPTIEWGSITGTLSSQTDLQDVLSDKQEKLESSLGNIGVGKSDASASEKLDVNGNVKASLFKDQYGTLRSQRVITITGNITLSEIHNGAILHITNTCNITIPTGLGANFSCDCYVKGAFIATFVNGGVTLNSPSGLLLKTDKMCTLYSNSANSLNLLGELATS